MPVVPKYGTPKIQRQALPGVRLNANAPSAAFQAPQPIDTSGLTEAIARIHDAEERKADQVAELGFATDLSKLKGDLLYGDNGVLKMEGENAFAAPEKVKDAWAKGVSQIEQKYVKNDRQRMTFQRHVAEGEISLDEQVERHVAGERGKYDAHKTDSYLDSQKEAAINGFTNPAEVETAVQNTTAAINDWATRHGIDKDSAAQELSKRLTQLHAGVIDQMTATDQDMMAVKYFNDHKQQIAPSARPAIQKALDESSLRGSAQRKSDEIMKQFGNESDALGAVRQIEDPKLRDAVQERVEHEWSLRRAVQRENEDDLFERATNIIDAHPNANPRSVIPPALWNSLSLGQRSSLKSYSDYQSDDGTGGEGSHNAALYLQFLDLTPQQMGALNTNEFMTKYWSKFDKSHRAKAETEWKSARDAANKPATMARSTTGTLRQMVKTALEQSKLVNPRKPKSKLSADEAQLPADVYDEVEDRVLEAEADGKKLSPIERKQVVDRVILDRAFAVPGRKTIDVKQRGRLVAQVVKEKDGTVRVPFNNIPADQREKIKAAFTQSGARSITRDRVERAYAALVLSNYSLYESILAER